MFENTEKKGVVLPDIIAGLSTASGEQERYGVKLNFSSVVQISNSSFA